MIRNINQRGVVVAGQSTTRERMGLNAEDDMWPTLGIIMLGTGGVGKSTVRKQVARSFGNDCPSEDAAHIREVVDELRKQLRKYTSELCDVIMEDFEMDVDMNEETSPPQRYQFDSDEAYRKASLKPIEPKPQQEGVELDKPRTEKHSHRRRSVCLQMYGVNDEAPVAVDPGILGLVTASVAPVAVDPGKIMGLVAEEEPFEEDPSEYFFDCIEEVQMMSNRGMKQGDYPALAKALQSIWNERIFKTAHAKMEKTLKQSISLKDKEKYLKLATIDMFAGRIEELFQSSFTLSPEEYIDIRIPTTGTIKTNGHVLAPSVKGGKPHQQMFELLDVGGQAHFRLEWPSIIKSSKIVGRSLGVLFIISLVDYGFNFEAALEVWDKTVSSDLLTVPHPVPITLVLNKVDLFRLDLLHCTTGFHETHTETKEKGPDESEDAYEDRCIEAVLDKFKSSYQHSAYADTSHLPFSWHISQATDPSMVTSVVTSVLYGLAELNHKEGGT